MDAAVSSPSASIERFAASAAPDPPDEPPAVRVGSYGLRVEPNIDPYVSPAANSLSVVFPRMIAPALRSLSTTNASYGGR